MKTATILIVTALGLATFAMNANATVSAWVCKNNKGSQVRFVDNPYDCSNGEQQVQLDFYADYIVVLNDTDYRLTSNSTNFLSCRPNYNTYGMSGIRLVDKSASTSCPYGYFLGRVGYHEYGVEGSCHDVNNQYNNPNLNADCKLDAKTN